MNTRIDNLEVRFNFDSDRDAEIVKHFQGAGGEYCCTILWWVKDSEGYSIHTIGGRIFGQDIDRDTLWKLMKYGQTVMEARFSLDQQ